MHARLIAVGERMPGWIAAGFAKYVKRLAGALPLELVEIKPGGRRRSRAAVTAVAAEGAALLAAVPRGAHAVVLDGCGEAWSSEQLAHHLSTWRLAGRDLAFLIGGPDGHAPDVLQRADQRWSLGPATLPHMLVRLLVVEQLYRATTILGGHPYHRA
jgi:23S rRNA (pseudouridine1915-N3)-methyltransferase